MSEPHELRAYEYVNRPYASVRDALHADPAGIFGRATKGAAHRAGSLAASLKVDVGSIEVGTDIAIEIVKIEDTDDGPHGSTAGSARGHARATRVELRWKAAHAAALFPSMEAVLSVYALSKDETQLDLRGRYQPPFGAVGAAVDTLVMHRLADASIHRFVTDVAERLRAEIPPA